MSEEKMPDIRIELNLTPPDIQIGVDQITPGLDIAISAKGEPRETYNGAYHAESLIETPQVFPTKDKIMKDDFTVDEVTVFKVSNPAGGWTYYIGK